VDLLDGVAVNESEAQLTPSAPARLHPGVGRDGAHDSERIPGHVLEDGVEEPGRPGGGGDGGAGCEGSLVHHDDRPRIGVIQPHQNRFGLGVLARQDVGRQYQLLRGWDGSYLLGLESTV